MSYNMALQTRHLSPDLQELVNTIVGGIIALASRVDSNRGLDIDYRRLHMGLSNVMKKARAELKKVPTFEDAWDSPIYGDDSDVIRDHVALPADLSSAVVA